MALSVCFLAHFHGRFMSIEDFVLKKDETGHLGFQRRPLRWGIARISSLILSPKDIGMLRLRERAVRARCPLLCVVRLICMVCLCPLVLFPKNERNRASRLFKKATLMGHS